MLGTSIAAVVLGCFYFCPLDCDASADWKNIKVAHLLRVLPKNGIYTYLIRIQNFLFHSPFNEIYRHLLFSLSGVLFPREWTTHLNETVEHDNIRESDRHDRRYVCIASSALPMYKTTCHAKPYLQRSVQYRYLSTVCV